VQRARIAVPAMLAAAAMVFVAGCGGDDEAATGGGGGGNSGGGGGGKKEIVYVPGLTGNPFYSTVACGAKSVASKYNVDFSVQGSPEFDVAKQTAVVNALVARKPDAIMISHTDPKAMIPPLKAAQEAGIKIMTIDGDLADTSIAVSNIQSNNLEGGRLAGERMAKLIGEKGTVIAIDNDPGFPISEQRVQGFKDAIAKYPNIKYLGVKYSHNEVANAANIVSTTAGSNPDLVGVYTAETNNTEGAITGVREAGKEGKIKIVGYDTSDPIVEALRDGKLHGDIVQYPYGEGQKGIETLAAAIDGKDVPRNQSAPFVVATPDNVDTPKVQKYIYKLNC
jgi:ribose transport system substrate-binding protein